ncbi:MAG: acetyl-CoA carboxylase biotin carboxyl carrier protein [Deinococcus sp.]|nr:acetyl-CoA carboxylase biotin carboxyl carrier protein [Deinococcus sp.]
MTSKELKQILQALIEYQVSELSLETPDYKLSVKRGQVLLAQAPDSKIPVVHAPAVQITPQAQPAGQNHPPVSAETAQAAAEKRKIEEVRAPIVGTFFRSPSPEAEAFVKEGDRVEKGQVLCIIEAMKLMNEIESEFSGTIRKILVQNAEPVEYGQVLFLIDPS